MSAAETQMDLDRITHPLRLARGSHQPGSGKGCAMNSISYINGDEHITDFPTCSARPLAIVVQSCNDLLAGPGGYLSPENSVLALELAWQTVGTAGVADSVVHAWLAELLTNPAWGVVQYAKITAVKAILDIAELHRQAARGDMPAIAAWDAADCAARAADCAARAAACAASPTSNGAGEFAIRAAYESTTLVNVRHYQSTLDAAIAFAVRAHARAAADTASSCAVELARQAIGSWRHLAGLNNSANEATWVDNRRTVVSQAEFVLAQ
jgi:hypothetical protein